MKDMLDMHTFIVPCFPESYNIWEASSRLPCAVKQTQSLQTQLNDSAAVTTLPPQPHFDPCS